MITTDKAFVKFLVEQLRDKMGDLTLHVMVSDDGRYNVEFGFDLEYSTLSNLQSRFGGNWLHCLPHTVTPNVNAAQNNKQQEQTMDNMIITDVAVAKAAYDAGKAVYVDVDATPLRFISDTTTDSYVLDSDWGGNWYKVDDEYPDEKWSADVVFKKQSTQSTQITTLDELATFIQSGGGDCNIGSLVIDNAEALKLQKQGKEIIRDCDDKTRHVAINSDAEGGWSYTCDCLLGGDWDYVALEDEQNQLTLVNFFDSLKDVDLYAYDVDQYRVATYEGDLSNMDASYGGNWFLFNDMEAGQIAKFAAKAPERQTS